MRLQIDTFLYGGISELGQQHDLELPSVYSRSTSVSGNTGSTFSYTLDSERFMILAGTEAMGHLRTLSYSKPTDTLTPSYTFEELYECGMQTY